MTYKNLVDIKTLFDIKNDETSSLVLSEPIYDFSDKEIGIHSPILIKSSCGSKLIFTRIVIVSSNVSISDLNLSGSVIIDSVDNVSLKNCTFESADPGSSGAIVINRGSVIEINNLLISRLSCPALFIETQSLVNIKYCRFFNSTDTLIFASNQSQLFIEQCELYQTPSNGITLTTDSFADVKDSEIHHTQNPAIQAIYSKLICTNSYVHDVDQNGINVSHCNETRFINNRFKNIKSSSISISFRSNGFISENTFEDINGNSIYVSEESKATILKNTITRICYPAFAVLQRCSVQISYNKISKVNRAGICIRGANRAVLDYNEIEDVKDCGVSISDSINCVLMHNNIKKCNIAGFEAYNQAKVAFYDNQITDCGEFGIMVYTGATVTASRNKFTNISNAFIRFSTKGGGIFTSNDVVKCSKQLDGDTSGTFLFRSNIPFESITNDEKNEDDDVKKVPRYVDPLLGKCLKCGKASREVFLVPCGHKIFCEECGQKAVEANENCPLCRFKILSITEGFSNSDDTLCSICLENQSDSIVLPCGHTGFCSDCLNEWFTDKYSCPVCRAEPAAFKKIISDF